MGIVLAFVLHMERVRTQCSATYLIGAGEYIEKCIPD